MNGRNSPNQCIKVFLGMSDILHPQWMTAKEAAAYLRISHRTILAWAKSRKIRGHVLSGTRRVTWRFLRTDLDATLTPPSAALDMEESEDAA